MRFERIANPYNIFRRIANPPKRSSVFNFLASAASDNFFNSFNFLKRALLLVAHRVDHFALLVDEVQVELLLVGADEGEAAHARAELRSVDWLYVLAAQ